MTRWRITYRKSGIGYAQDQRATLVALGLKRLQQTVEHDASESIRGMVFKVRHLVNVDGIPADAPEAAGLLGRPVPEIAESAP